ncbi:hypothetical protein K456DRAFT_421560 [Colletotrichum gloeosporioides 23]|nr:hypothetical protein K456DRAFT_421560 [Colletotrichum gloeosporioides 23]
MRDQEAANSHCCCCLVFGVLLLLCWLKLSIGRCRQTGGREQTDRQDARWMEKRLPIDHGRGSGVNV